MQKRVLLEQRCPSVCHTNIAGSARNSKGITPSEGVIRALLCCHENRRRRRGLLYVLTVYPAESWAPRCVAQRQKCSKGKGKGRALVIAPHSRHGRLRGAQVHGAHQAASHIPALYLPSRSWYSFTDPERMEG